MGTVETYDALADHYHLIFENWEISIERHGAAVSSLLRGKCGLPSEARILDCACGIGTQVLGLAKMGFRVSGSDFSARAVERARREASQRKLDIPFLVADMLNLVSVGDSPFDAVICMDNALPHLENEQIIQAAKQFRSKLHRSGYLIASIRDYDRLIEERPRLQEPSFYSDNGRRRIVFQIWDWLDERRYTFHLYITRELVTGWQTLHASASYRVVLRDELSAALVEAGFANIRWLSERESGFYQPIVIAEAC